MTLPPVRRIARVWISLELGAGILALALLVAVLPLVVIAFPAYQGRSIPFWAVAVDILVISLPLAVILGAAALRLVVQPIDGGRQP